MRLTIAVHLVSDMICAKGHTIYYLSHFSAPTVLVLLVVVGLLLLLLLLLLAQK